MEGSVSVAAVSSSLASARDRGGGRDSEEKG